MADLTESGLPRIVAIAWGVQATPQRGPSRGLTHEKIVQRAVEIADQHGLPAVTMQRLAESLGFTTMSLYRYVANKDELLMLMLGSEWLLPPRPAPSEDWRADLRGWADSLRQMYRDHPWLLDVVRGPASVLLPSSVQVVDRGMEAVRQLPLDESDAISLILVVSSYVAAFAGLERDLAGQQNLQFGPDALRELAEVITPDKFAYAAPLILSGGYAGSPDPDDLSLESEYQFGIDLLLNGLAARVGARAPAPPEE